MALWQWDMGMQARSFAPVISFTQQGFTNAAAARSHEEGWASTLRNLARQFPGERGQ